MEYNFKRLASNLAANQLNQDIFFSNINKEIWWQMQGEAPTNLYLRTQIELKIYLQKYSDYLK